MPGRPLTVRTLLPLMVVVVVFMLVLICPGMGRDNNPAVPRNTRILFVTEMLLGVGAMVAFFILRKKYCTSPLWLNADSMRVYLSNEVNMRAITSYITNHANIIGVYIFGAGSIVLNAAYLYYEAQCINFFQGEGLRFSDEQVRLLTSCVKLIMVILEIPLLHYMTRITFAHSRHLAATGSILVLIGANSALWLFNYMTESHILDVFPKYDYNVTVGVDIGSACFNNSSVMGVFANTQMENLFFPFYMEFCIVAIEVLYGVYFVRTVRYPIVTQMTMPAEQHQNTIQQVLDITNTQNVCLVPTGFHRTDVDGEDGEHEELDGPTYEENERSPLLDGHSSIQHRARAAQHQAAAQGGDQGVAIEIVHPVSTTIDQEQPLYIRGWSYFLYAFNPLTAMIVGIFQAILIVAFMQQKDTIGVYISEEYFYQYCAAPAILFSIVFDAIPMLFITSYCLAIFTRFRAVRHNPVSLRTVLYFCLFGISILCCFRMIVIAIDLSRANALRYEIAVSTLSLFETLFFWPQYYLQAILLYFGQRRRPDPLHPLYGTLQGCLSYLTMTNLMRWITWSFLEVGYLRSRVELANSTNGWDQLVLLISPLFIYFYFVCTFLLLDLKSLLKDRPPARWQLTLAVTSLRPHMR